MTYSFTKLKPKHLVSFFTKIWIILFIFATFFIFSMHFLYHIKVLMINSNIKNQVAQEKNAIEQRKQNERLYAILLEQSKIAKKQYESNKMLNISLKNLFDMVIKSDSISLDSLEWINNELHISGISPSREKFILAIETPLKSVFDDSKTSYYKLDNGWYRFVNVSKKEE